MGKTADRNADAIADLKRRLALAYGILFGSLAMIPLGFLCPCGLAIVVSGTSQALAAAAGIAALLLPFVGLGALLLMTGDRSKYTRGLAVAEVAESRGLRYTYEPKKKQYQFLRGFRLLADPDHDSASNLMTGKLSKLPVAALDYSHAYGHGATAIVYRAAMVVFKEGFEDLPSFVLYPRGWLDKVSDLVSGRPLKFSDSPRFNKTFAVVTDESAAVQAVFTEQLVKLCLKEENLMLEIRQGMLLAYCYESVLDTQAYEDFLALVEEIVDELQREDDE